jgi:hypothetical protein
VVLPLRMIPQTAENGLCPAFESYFFFGLWLRALPAADFESLLVRPSRSTVDAFLATLALVTLLFATSRHLLPPNCIRRLRRS